MHVVLNYYTVSSLLIFITGALFGLVIYSKNRKALINKAFGLFALSVAGWSGFYYLWQLSSEPNLALLYTRILMAFAIFIPANYFFIALAFLEKVREKLWQLLLAYLISFIFLALDATPLMVASVEKTQYHDLWPMAGPVFGIFLIVWFCIVLYPTILLSTAYKSSSSPERRKQITMILWGIFLAFLAGSTNYFQWFRIPIPPVGNLIGPIWVVLISYAIIKQNLLNIEIIITEVALYLINGILIVELILSQSSFEFAYRAVLVLLAVYVSYIAIRSTRHEIEQKEKIQKLAKDLEMANNNLKELDKVKDDFLSMASHELNTPIAAIEGYLSMILVEHLAGVIPPKAKTYLDSVYASSQRLAHLVRDLLNVSRIESGRIHLLYEQKPVEDIIKQAVMEVNSKAIERQHTLTFEQPAAPLPLTWYDATRITEIIINMIGNSIKYTEPGGKIVVKAMADDQKIVVSVADNGRGIPLNRQDAIFQKFTQADVLKDQQKGTGLGMYISKKFIELHKGQIWFHSDGEGKGTTFFFSLPILKDKPADEHEGEGPVLH